MKTVVVDACVAIKWFIPENYTLHAQNLWKKNTKLLVPNLLFAEIGNILWKKQRFKEISKEDACQILSDFQRLPLESCAIELLLNDAWQIAITYQCTFYDALYVALALKEECLLVTADQKLFNILQDTPLAKLMIWIEDIP